MDDKEAIECLNRLRDRVNMAISMIENGWMVYDPKFCKKDLLRVTRDETTMHCVPDFRIGEFCIYDEKLHAIREIPSFPPQKWTPLGDGVAT